MFDVPGGIHRLVGAFPSLCPHHRDSRPALLQLCRSGSGQHERRALCRLSTDPQGSVIIAAACRCVRLSQRQSEARVVGRPWTYLPSEPGALAIDQELTAELPQRQMAARSLMTRQSRFAQVTRGR